MKPWFSHIVLSLLLMTFSHGGVAKKVYKWVDEQGVIHYSDSTPASAMNDEHNVNQVSVTEDLPAGNYRGVAKKHTYTDLSRSSSDDASTSPSRGKDPATQCYSAIKNLTAGMKAVKQEAKKKQMERGMKESEFEAKFSDAMSKIEGAKASCVESYDSGKSKDIDCLANLTYPEEFVYCMYASKLTGFSGY